MDSDIVGSILLQVVLIAVNAVFACAEIAVVSCNDAKLEKMAQEGNKRAAKLFHLTEQPSRFLATIQVALTTSGSRKCLCSRKFFGSNRFCSCGRGYEDSGKDTGCDCRCADYAAFILYHPDLWRTGAEKDCNAEG